MTTASAPPSIGLVPCPLCGSDRWSVYVRAPSHYGPEKHQVTRCADCGMIFTNPQLTTYEKQVEKTGVLHRHLDPEQLRGASRQAALQLSLIAPFVPGHQLFDFGCGAGALVNEAKKAGWDAVGLDLNRGLVQAANAHWKFDALKSGFLDEFIASNQTSFDAIVSNQVFEHLQDPVKIGCQLVGLLKPGGCILIDVPNVFQLGEWRKRGQTLDPTSHWSHFSAKTLSNLIQKIGCDVVYRSAAPALVGLYQKLGLGKQAIRAGRWTKGILPPVGTGVCVIGKKRD